MKAYSHLSAQERIRIDELRNRDGLGVCQIALRMGRGKSTVSREPGRGPWFASDENGSYLCFVKLGSAFCAVFFRSVGSGFSAGCAVSAAACLRCVGYLVMRACSLR